MHLSRSLFFRLILTSVLFGGSGFSLFSEGSGDNLEYVLDRYLEVMGGSASLESIVSIYLTGAIVRPEDTRIPISILKKRPNKVRIIQHLKDLKVIHGFDGEKAWTAIESDDGIVLQELDSDSARQIIESAPMENLLVDVRDTGAVLELAGEVDIARSPCYQILARFPDGSNREFLIEKETFLDRRVSNFDSEGKLVTEFIPSNFKTVNGVLFAMKQLTRVDGEVQSTLLIDEVNINMGILDTLFSPPGE